ncbi:hypothetical protein [Brasilonema sp. UFV-L1]|nr:hypothetical protein [Brasilonema sp. UFV-L1]
MMGEMTKVGRSPTDRLQWDWSLDYRDAKRPSTAELITNLLKA